MIKLLHRPIKAPRGVLRVTNTTSRSQPSLVESVRRVRTPWSVFSGKLALVWPAGCVEEEEKEAGRGGRGG